MFVKCALFLPEGGQREERHPGNQRRSLTLWNLQSDRERGIHRVHKHQRSFSSSTNARQARNSPPKDWECGTPPEIEFSCRKVYCLTSAPTRRWGSPQHPLTPTREHLLNNSTFLPKYAGSHLCVAGISISIKGSPLFSPVTAGSRCSHTIAKLLVSISFCVVF